MHHTLLAHNGSRNPLIAKGGTHDLVNNVIYDWGGIASEVNDGDSNSFVNFTGNFFRPGPSEKEPGSSAIIVTSKGVPKLYVEGNHGPLHPGEQAGDWALVSYEWTQQEAPVRYRSAQRFETWPVTATTADAAFQSVLKDAGATRPQRDAVDARVAADAKNGTGKIINSPGDAGGYPQLAGGSAPIDSDHDGIPDDWETAHGLDPHDPADGAKPDAAHSGYTHLEVYLHSLAG